MELTKAFSAHGSLFSPGGLPVAMAHDPPGHRFGQPPGLLANLPVGAGRWAQPSERLNGWCSFNSSMYCAMP